MLTHLTISNIVLIDHISIDVPNGLCALTGETGAGKSIILDALGLVLGQRAETRLIRDGEEEASVTASFDLPRHTQDTVKTLIASSGLSLEDSTLIMRRIIRRDGRNKVFINDQPCTQTLLMAIGSELGEIHGQFETHGLLDPQNHLNVLDRFGRLIDLREQTSETWSTLSKLHTQKAELIATIEQAQKEEDYLRHALDELDKLNPQPNEEPELVEKRKLYMNAEKLIEAVSLAENALQGRDGGRDQLHSALAALERRADEGGEAMEPIIDGLNRASIEIDEALHRLEQFMSDLDLNPTEQNDIEERLFALRATARKHSTTVAELPDVLNDIKQRLQLITDQTDALNGINKEIKAQREAYLKHARALHDQRIEAAKTLQTAIMKEFPPIKLEKAEFTIAIKEKEESQWDGKGLSDISFLISTNPGSAPAPLHKIASGGELARFMLAVKVVLNDEFAVPIMIFDEVDTGISGATADAVGRRLARLGQKQQVLLVTHSPQVAACADHHLQVSKNSSAESTTTSLLTLKDEDRIEEIARLLSGESITGEARNAAISLLKKNNQAKAA